ncbi:unnamed protein product [Hymenolepis diminuta]|uniref:Glyco_hydro_59M domain-containing protein n=1 Tax=Hymenolepis diminuta TaxID=6216 RepID=A0A0R3SC82_HYMDI|nr:unnamed protein product [Hymenolepis diminuta]
MEISYVFAGLCSLLILINPCIGYTIPLTGKWGLTDSNISVNFTLNSTFGTDIYSVLQTKRFIPNPLTGYGDTKLRPLSYGNWTYSHYFFLDYKDTSKTIFLELDQIDSYCCVYLNRHLLICTNNSFIHYSVPISPFIRYRWNFLQLKFNSTPKMAKSAYQKLAPNPPPPKCWPSTFNGECFINAVRTTQASFGWDWGPAFPIQGFWKTPVLRFNVLWLGDGVQFYPTLKGSTWKAGVSVEILGGDPNSKVCVIVKLGGGLMKNWEKRCVLIERNGYPLDTNNIKYAKFIFGINTKLNFNLLETFRHKILPLEKSSLLKDTTILNILVI